LKPTASRRNIKRKVGYENEDEEIAGMQKGIVNMVMNDEDCS
jgi:hypothetical protein